MFDKLNEEKGFTLVELLTVVVIIAALVTIVVPNLLRAVEKSRVTAAVADFMGIKNAVLEYYSDTGDGPNSSTDGSDPGLVKDPAVNGWGGPYLERWPAKNPWGGAYSLVEDSSLFDDNKPARCLCLDNVPAGAVDKLEEQLGGDNVKNGSGESGSGGDPDCVYLLMFKD